MEEGERMWTYGDGVIKLNPDDELPEQITFEVNYDDIVASLTKRQKPKRKRKFNNVRRLKSLCNGR